MTHDWYPAEPQHANDWLKTFDAPWWIAGGWAVDLFLERISRPHGDLDIGVLRDDVPALQHHLQGWRFFEAKDGKLTDLERSVRPRPDVNSLWCRREGSSVWELELMLEQASGDQWIYRRDPKLRRQFVDVIRRSACGLRYLAPEVQLLYKAKGARPRDNADFRSVIPRLDETARDWLRSALTATQPDHAWLVEME